MINVSLPGNTDITITPCAGGDLLLSQGKGSETHAVVVKHADLPAFRESLWFAIDVADANGKREVA